MALKLIGKGKNPTYLALSTDMTGSTLTGATIVGGTVYLTDTGAWKIVSAANTAINLTFATTAGATFGDLSNYTEFASNGHQTMVGTATVWEDLRLEPVARTTGTNAPTFEKWYDDIAGTSRGVYLYSFDDVAE